MADDLGRHHDFGGLAGEGFLEADFHVVAEIGAALAPAAALPAAGAALAHHVAEDVVEDVRHGGAEVAREAGGPVAAVLEGGVAEAVVRGALLRILQDLVGRGDFLELDLGAVVARIAVRVILHGELAEGGLQRLVVGGALDAEEFVVVGFGSGHDVAGGLGRKCRSRRSGSAGFRNA